MDTEKEIWKKIDGFETYEVSNFGKIKNILKNNILSNIEEGGYLRVSIIGSDKKIKSFLLHRLVAHAFIPNP
jgi:hypothetical protein